MKRLILFFLLVSAGIYAQTGIGTTSPHASAKLEVSASNKGFLPPRVTLTSVTDASTITSPAVGLLVYNVGSAGLQAGYYYWNGANWSTIATASTAGNAVVAMDMVKLYAKRFVNYSTGIVSSSGHSFTVPVSGKYIFDFSSTAYAVNTLFSGYFQIRNSSNGVIGADTIITANNYQHVEFNGKVEVNLQANTTYNAYVSYVNGSRDINDYDRVYYKLIAGNLPVNQHIADRNIQLNNNYLSNDGGNEGIRIDNAGNVGIGSSTPTTALTIQNGNSLGSGDPGNNVVPSIYLYNSNNSSTTAHSILGIRTNGDGGGNPYLSFDINGIRGHSIGIDNADSDKLKFHTNWNFNNASTPTLTLTADNKIGVGTSNPNRKLHIQSADDVSVYIESSAADNNGMLTMNGNTGTNWANNWHEFIIFQKQGTQIGNIQGANGGTQVAYNTSSDYRLKTDFRNYNGLALVNQIKTYDYAWKANNTRMFGVKAHELQEIIPYLVSGEKDAVDQDGKIKPQSVDYSKLTPILVKAIQEQDIKILQLAKEKDALEQRIHQLELLIQKKGN